MLRRSIDCQSASFRSAALVKDIRAEALKVAVHALTAARASRICDRDALTLAAGQAAAALAHQRVITFRQFQNEIMRAGKFGGPRSPIPSARMDRPAQCCHG
jgi:hypothetical protein